MIYVVDFSRNRKLNNFISKIFGTLYNILKMLNKKAIGPVIAASLLIVVAVAALIGFQNWYNSYQTSILTEVDSKNDFIDLNI